MGLARIHLSLKPLWEGIVPLPAVSMSTTSQVYSFFRPGKEWFYLGMVFSNLHLYLCRVARLHPPCFCMAWNPFSIYWDLVFILFIIPSTMDERQTLFKAFS